MVSVITIATTKLFRQYTDVKTSPHETFPMYGIDTVCLSHN